MNTRQKDLFKNIVKEHIDSAKAVGSKFLVDKYNLQLSSATIRNDMAELEKQGLIYQPHTSAGRVPTEQGYKYFIDNYLSQAKQINKKDKESLDKLKKELAQVDNELAIKNIAKLIAQLSNATVVVGFAKNNVYYTGISNLFSQPEFADFNLIHNISEVVDHLDDVVNKIFDSIKDTQIEIGQDNCFDNNCASILTKTNNKLFGILGPMRMHYERNLSLINYCRNFFPN